MKKIIMLTLVLILLSITSFGLENSKKKNDEEYKKFYKKFISLYKNKKYLETAKLIEKNFDRFPDKMYKMAFNATIAYIKANKPDNVIRIFNNALKKGMFFSKYMLNSRHFVSLKDLDAFKKILILNEQNRLVVQKKSKVIYEVVLPVNYDKKKKYPLFIALHGGSSNIKRFKPRWTSDLLKAQFITVYVQSSQVITMDGGFEWGDLKITKKDLMYMYNDIKAKYLIDKKNILIGGFSSGGYGSIFSAFKQIFPIKGFIALCPVVPENIAVSDMKKMKKIGLSGVIISSDLDPRIKLQKEFTELLKKEGIKNHFIITPNIGHWFPKDLDKKIDQAIKFINIEIKK